MLNHNYIGTEHILLGLIREGEGVGAQVLEHLGVELDRVRREIMELLDSPAGGVGWARSPVVPPAAEVLRRRTADGAGRVAGGVG